MILPKEVWTICQVLIVTFAKGGTLVMTLENSIATTQRTVRYRKVLLYFREISISLFWVCASNKLNIFKEGKLVFTDAGSAGATGAEFADNSSCSVNYRGGNIWGPPQPPYVTWYPCYSCPKHENIQLALRLGSKLGVMWTGEWWLNGGVSGNGYCA